MDIKITSYAPEHFEQIIALCNEFQDYLVEIDPEKRLRRTDEYGVWSTERKVKALESGKGSMFVALDGERVVGFVFGTFEPELPAVALYSSEPQVPGTIEELTVTKEYRGQGIGKLLMSKIEEDFTGKGCTHLNVSVLAFNDGAHRLYRGLGYSDRGVWMTKKV